MSTYSNRSLETLLWLLTLLLLLVPNTAAAQLPFALKDNGRPTLAPVLENVMPAVVNISVTSKTPIRRNPLYDDPFFRRFFNLPEQGPVVPRQSVGSGVIVDARNGYVLSNHHVVADAAEIAVTLQDRRSFEAELVGSDAGTDIALLKINASNLRALKIGDSKSLRVGDFVLAIGNPFGLGQTVTSGIVSALGRSGINVEGYEDFIQTDASINPGNSGGALVDLEGKLVGINTAIIAPAGGNVGIGFAVPVHMATAVMEQLLEYGEVRRGELGIMTQDITPDLAQALVLSTAEGAVISQVEPGSTAEAAGLKAGDVVIAVDDQPISGSAALRNRIGLLRVGEAVKLTIVRDGRSRTMPVKVGKTRVERLIGDRSIPQLSGAEFRNLDRRDPQYGEVEGVLVAQVDHGSQAWRSGLRRGDIVLEVNRQRVATVDELSAALHQSGPALALNLLRGNLRLFLVIP